MKGQASLFSEENLMDLIDERHIKRVKASYESFVAPEITERSVLEAITFSIATQANDADLAMNLVRSMEDWPVEKLKDADAVYKQTLRGKTAYPHLKNGGFVNLWPASPEQNRYEGIHTWLEENYTSSGLLRFASDLLGADHEMRKSMERDVRWWRCKTISMLYLCLGGTRDWLTIDRHVRRTLPRWGVPVEPRVYQEFRRPAGQRSIRDMQSLSADRYREVENTIVAFAQEQGLSERFSELRNEDGTPHTGMLTTLFFYEGAGRRRRTYCYPVGARIAKNFYTQNGTTAPSET